MSVRPTGVGRPAFVLAAIAGAFLFIARSTGSGWLVVVGCGVVGTLVVALVWPAIALASVRIAATVPRDGTVGSPVSVHLEAAGMGGPMRMWLLDLAAGPSRLDPPGRGDVIAVPERRGIVKTLRVEVVSSAPFGFFPWRRRMVMALPTSIEVGPRPREVSLASVLHAGESGSDVIPRGRLGHESVRGVREYAPGDPIRLIHWPSTARFGDLRVKEMENPDAPVLILVVDLRGSSSAAEDAASRAAGIARAALASGLPLRMLTVELDGPVDGPVGTPLEVGRRLARAVPGQPGATGPVAGGASVVTVSAS